MNPPGVALGVAVTVAAGAVLAAIDVAVVAVTIDDEELDFLESDLLCRRT